MKMKKSMTKPVFIPEISVREEIERTGTKKGFFIPGVYTIFFIIIALLSLYSILYNFSVMYQYSGRKYSCQIPLFMEFLFAMGFVVWRENLKGTGEKHTLLSILSILSFLAFIVFDVIPRAVKAGGNPYFNYVRFRYYTIRVKNLIWLLTSVLSIKASLIYIAPRGMFKHLYFGYEDRKRPECVRVE